MNESEYYGSILTRFQPCHLIDEGGFGVVYQGFSKELNIEVAIKIFKKEEHDNKKYLDQFINEAQKVAGINHPNIIRIYDNNTKEYYFVMRLLDESFSEQLKSRGGMLHEGKVIRLAIEITRALCELSDQKNFEQD